MNLDSVNWCFETSALNYMIKQFSLEDASATRAFQRLRGRRWYISPVTLWEVMVTTSKERRSELIYFSKHLFEPRLLISPEEIIVGFIEKGAALHEPRRSIISDSNISEVWSDISANPEKTLMYNADQFREQVDIARQFARLAHRIVRTSMLDLSPNSMEAAFDVTLQSALESLNFGSEIEHLREDDKQTLKLSAFFIIIILCAELAFNSQPFKEFWSRLGIAKLEDRVQYIFRELPILVRRGPFYEMALMAHCQSKSKFSRGIYFDCMHSIYLPYVQALFSNDEHFRQLRDSIHHPNYLKITLLDEVELYYPHKVSSSEQTENST